MLAAMTDCFPRVRDPDVFPPGVSQFSVRIPADAAAARRMAGVELPAALERAAARRQIQFLAGRVCAREAISRLRPRVPAGPLPQGEEGCPVWPDGLVGSISHAESFATAAVARRIEAHGL
jgi:enterobactin synthetase component D